MRSFRTIRLFWAIGILSLIAVLSMNIVTGEEQAQPSPSPSPSLAKPPLTQRRSQSGCLVDEFALEDIKKAKEEIETKRKELDAREIELKAREQGLAEEVKKLGTVREDFEKSQNLKKLETSEKVGKLVEILLTMSPKAASKVISTLNDHLAVAVLSQMDTQRLAKIMNVMDTAKSSQLSEMMVGIETPKVRKSVPMQKMAQQTSNQNVKGGEKSVEHPAKNGSAESGKSVPEPTQGPAQQFTQQSKGQNPSGEKVKNPIGT